MPAVHARTPRVDHTKTATHDVRTGNVPLRPRLACASCHGCDITASHHRSSTPPVDRSLTCAAPSRTLAHHTTRQHARDGHTMKRGAQPPAANAHQRSTGHCQRRSAGAAANSHAHANDTNIHSGAQTTLHERGGAVCGVCTVCACVVWGDLACTHNPYLGPRPWPQAHASPHFCSCRS